MRTTVDLPKGLLAEARRAAAEKGTSFSAYLEQVVRTDLVGGAARTVEVSLPTVNTGGPRPAFEAASNQDYFAQLDKEDLAQWSL